MIFASRKNGRVALQRMDNVGIVVESLDDAISSFAELGLELEGRPAERAVPQVSIEFDVGDR